MLACGQQIFADDMSAEKDYLLLDELDCVLQRRTQLIHLCRPTAHNWIMSDDRLKVASQVSVQKSREGWKERQDLRRVCISILGWWSASIESFSGQSRWSWHFVDRFVIETAASCSKRDSYSRMLPVLPRYGKTLIPHRAEPVSNIYALTRSCRAEQSKLSGNRRCSWYPTVPSEM